ncbi:lachesin-like [Eriocheir sinensis]|uniref:lachesin-like n=1 Tax=Eriocheir sinensis TaxID=95602 RepID=UPI0021C629EA|nr:lachesin-like [Eriocheir sinensis]
MAPRVGSGTQASHRLKAAVDSLRKCGAAAKTLIFVVAPCPVAPCPRHVLIVCLSCYLFIFNSLSTSSYCSLIHNVPHIQKHTNAIYTTQHLHKRIYTQTPQPFTKTPIFSFPGLAVPYVFLLTTKPPSPSTTTSLTFPNVSHSLLHLHQPQPFTKTPLFSSPGLAVRTPSISWITKEQVVDIGSSVQLECSVQYSQDYPVLWVKRGSGSVQDLPISTGPGLIIRDSRYSLRHDKGSSTYALQIKDIQESDGGDYMCQVLIGINNRITANVNLLVRRPPVISDNSTRSVVASEGDSVELSCYAGGMPIPDISWRRENNAILPTGGSIYRGNVLQIGNIRKEDRGTYYCIAENQVGRGARRNINVEVEFAPVVKAIRPRVYQALQYDMDMECHVKPTHLAITWFPQAGGARQQPALHSPQFATADRFTDTTLQGVEY